MNELKKELSKLTGIDMFNPRFREVFKKYFPEDKDAEEERLEDLELNEDAVEDADVEPKADKVDEAEKEPEAKEEAKAEEDADDKEDDKPAEEPKEEPEAEPKAEALEQDIDKAEDEREIDKIEEEKAETPEVADEKKEELNEESEEIGKKVDEEKEYYNSELYDAKLELGLIKNHVREDRIEPAKKYIKSVIKDVKELDKIGDILKEFPEWTKREEHNIKGFGMPVDEVGDNLTEEEKRLKQMGIDPRN